MTTSSTFAAVVSAQFITARPSKYRFVMDSKPINPNSSDIPYCVTIALAIAVARSISLDAPVVTELNFTSSAARPPKNDTRSANISSFLFKYFSSSGRCIVYPSAPMVRGTIVIFCTGSDSFCNAITSACPTSWYATMCFSSSPRILSFFSLPAMTTSTASNKSFCETAFLPALTAPSAASLIILARSDPTAPLVASAISSKSTVSSIFTSLACTFNVSILPFKSGRSTITRRSKRPGRRRALSKTSGRFVAARIMIPLDVSNPSISASKAFNVCSRSSFPPPCIPLSRLLPIASISSIKIIHGAICCACLNKSRTLDAPTPTNICTKSDPESEKNGTPASPATALASNVLPVPGGPTSNAPFGSFAPISVYRSG